MTTFQEKIPPSHAMQMSHVFGNSQKAALKAHIEAILRSIEVALARIIRQYGVSPSGDIARVEQNYRALQARVLLVLEALNTGDHCLHELLHSSIALIDVALSKDMFENDKVDRQQTNADATAQAAYNTQLRQDIYSHPFIRVLSRHRDDLDALSKMNHRLKVDLAIAEEEGFKDLEKAIALSCVVAQTGSTATVEAMVAEAERMAQKEEAFAAEIKEENEMARHKKIATAIRMHAKAVHDAAIHIGQGMHQNVAAGHEQVMQAYQTLVVDPVQAALERTPEYYMHAHHHLGRYADAWQEQMKGAADHIRERLRASRKALGEIRPAATASAPADSQQLYSKWLHQSHDAIVSQSATLNDLLDTQASAISQETTRAQTALGNLSETLAGKQHVSEETVHEIEQVMGAKAEDVEKDIVAFQEAHGMLKSLIASVNAKWEKAHQALRRAKGGGHGDV